MNVHAIDRGHAPFDPALHAAVEHACGWIAPSWPLDRSIGVNPWWGQIGRPFEEVGADLAARQGCQAVPVRTWFRAQWQSGALRREHLAAALAESGHGVTPEALVAQLDAPEPAAPRRALFVDVLAAPIHSGQSWDAFVTDAVSRACASHFTRDGADPAAAQDLYTSCREQLVHERGAVLLMGARGWPGAASLPATADDAIVQASDALDLPRAELGAYFASLLLRQNGWASYCAWLRWEQGLVGADDAALRDLLAVRLLWEYVLFTQADADSLRRWRTAMRQWPLVDAGARHARALDWVLLSALELGYQSALAARLRAQRNALTRTSRPARAQLVFCIDVRSERLRRALERASPAITTAGFAGFFGLPLAYRPLGTARALPQLPGLLAPCLEAAEISVDPGLAQRRVRRLDLASAWHDFESGAVSTFAYVEALGLAYAARLLAETRGWLGAETAQRPGAGLRAHERDDCYPRLLETADGDAVAACAELVADILRGMSATRDFPRLVALVAHGSSSRNNPQAASLACGACGGHSGEVNARVLAALLNDAAVRAALPRFGIKVPPTTWFLAALHDTTTDVVTVYERERVPVSHRGDLVWLEHHLAAAGDRVRTERAPQFAGRPAHADALRRAFEDRSRHWAETRPEWGLAGNAAFVAAPRALTRSLDLGGRVFLHDYEAALDVEGRVLEQILTAPLVVAHWINLQYYASTVDNLHWGSGNKVLHNVVGERIGVLEGNGGDLRIGLALQSLHDGDDWRHTPLRLSAFVAAPRAAIDAVLARHETVRALVVNRWIHLFQLGDASGTVYRRDAAGWTPFEA